MKEEEDDQPHSIIPGLPDEIALDCLVRVPYRFHSVLKSVCRGWNRLLGHSEFYQQREVAHRAEAFVCLVQAVVASVTTEPAQLTESEKEKRPVQHYCPPVYGLTVYSLREDTWRRMPNPEALPAGIPMFCQCVAVGAKLVLIGGWDPKTLDSVADVYVWDFVRGGGWRRGAPMSVARSFFACAAVGFSVYVAGGHDNQKNALRSAEVYDVDTDTWLEIPPMADERDECQGLVDQSGRFWVVSGYGTDQQGRFDQAAECFDPVHGSWTRVDGIWPFPNSSPRGSCSEMSRKDNEFLKLQRCPGKITKIPSAPVLFPSSWFVGSTRGAASNGGNGNNSHQGLREYDPRDKSWKTTVPMPDTVCSSPSATIIRDGSSMDRIFVIGSGEVDGGPHRQRACVLDTRSRKWSDVDTPAEFSGFVYSASSICV